MRTRVHIGIQKKAGNIPILSRCVGTTPTHLKRPIGINNDTIVYGVVAASSRRSTIYPARRFLVIPSKQESTLSNIEKLSNLLHNVGALPSYVHHIL